MRVCFYTLGCKVNLNETGALEQMFRGAGFTIVNNTVVNMGGNVVGGVADGVAATDAVNKGQLDAGLADMAALTGTHASGVFRDALTGLTNLGYDETEAGQALKEVLAAEPDLDVSAALRAALKSLGQKRG